MQKPSRTWYQQVAGRLAGTVPEPELGALTRLLLKHYLPGYTTTNYLLNNPITVPPATEAALEQAITRLLRHEPIQYIIGYTEFCGHRFFVAPGVLIPRPETEQMVDQVIQQPLHPGARILDIGTGSGCIAISLKKAFPLAQVDAMDIDPKALAIAAKNSEQLGAQVNFLQQDILSAPLSGQVWDMMISNPPYIKLGEATAMQRNVWGYEPHHALFVPDDNPLIFYKRIAWLVKDHLAPGGRLYLEIHETAAQEVVALLAHAALTDIQVHRDLQGKERWVAAASALTRPPLCWQLL